MEKKIGLVTAISIGIGGMVGGGIFAVLGLAASMAKGGTPVSFLIAGLIALITSYSYVKLSQTYPDRGGTVKFINKGFGLGVFSGSINNLLWLKLETISTAGSVGFLLIFSAVNYTGFKLLKEVKGNRVLPFAGFLLCMSALVIMISQQMNTNKTGVIVAVFVVLFCFCIEWIYKNKYAQK